MNETQYRYMVFGTDMYRSCSKNKFNDIPIINQYFEMSYENLTKSHCEFPCFWAIIRRKIFVL